MCTDFPRSPKAMEEKSEQADPQRPWLWLALTLTAMEDHWRKRKTLRGFRSRIRVEQEMYLCDSKRHKPGLLKIISTEASLPPSPLHITPVLSALFIPTYLGVWLLSPFLPIPGLFLLLRKGDQVQLRDSKTCLLKKRNMTHPRNATLSSPVLCSIEKRGHYKL